MKKAEREAQKDYLRRCKNSSAETKLNWLAAALEFAKVTKKKKNNS